MGSGNPHKLRPGDWAVGATGTRAHLLAGFPGARRNGQVAVIARCPIGSISDPRPATAKDQKCFFCQRVLSCD